ncbi:MAG: response regulator [Oscillospiraceae bacterium]|nr:response regulator [Oscillospiraceae bacterium]
MFEKIKKHQRYVLVVLIVICMAIILVGGLRYVANLRENLLENAIQSVMTVTKQQQQAIDNFISEDRNRLHSFADYFARMEGNGPEVFQDQLTMFNEVDAVYSVICLDEGWFCSNSLDDIRWVEGESLEEYRALDSSGIRDTFVGQFSGIPRFGFYERFTFNTGHSGLIQKSYDRTKVSETFSLSFYNNQGLAYVVNQRGDILLRSVGMIGNRLYDNIFDILTGTNGEEEDIDRFMQALQTQEEGSMTFTGDMGTFVYTYVPVEHVDDWYLVSVVPLEAITEETDQMLLNSQMMLGLLFLILVTCAVFILLIWSTHRDIEKQEAAAAYHTRLFEVFTTYLSSNTDDVYMMMDHETEKLEYVSPNVMRVLGVKAADLPGFMAKGDQAADPEETAAYYATVKALTPGQSAEPRYTERINPQTGETRYFMESAYCADIQGKIKRVSYISDRTRERKTQNSLTEALHMAQAANDAKSAFLSNVSHDIRTPMNAIIGFLALMQDEADNPAMVIEYTQRIDAASQHLLGLINDVLDMNKIESGSTTLCISEMDLADVVDEINTIIRPQAKDKEQTFDIFVSHLNYEHLLGDKMRINQILINLLSNAVKYTPKGGRIELRVEERPQVVNNYSRIRFTVSDNGLGMSENYLKVIFDPFTREETKVTHEIQGTGLGMAITKSLVDLMGGTIRVESAPGEGSTFTVELELRIQEREDDPKFWTDHKVVRMIVADDDEEICRNIVATMAKTGVVTDYATSGETAIQMMRTTREAGEPYDLILLDWKMPDLNGLETARLIRKNYSDKIPILLLTAYDWSEIEQEAMEIGVSHFMPKPFFISTFKEAIRRVMGGPKTREGVQSDVVLGKHVLVVDDIEVNRIILVKILSTLGADCDTAGTGREAVEKFENGPPGEYDLILMDVQMPVMDGYEATRAIRSSSHPAAQKIPIIAMTANAFVDDVRDAIESGMDAHIAKPIQMDKLKATIQQVFDSRKEQAEAVEANS